MQTNIGSLSKYLDTFPNGLFQRELKELLEIKVKEEEVEEWARLLEENRLIDFVSFLKKYSNMKHLGYRGNNETIYSVEKILEQKRKVLMVLMEECSNSGEIWNFFNFFNMIGLLVPSGYLCYIWGGRTGALIVVVFVSGMCAILLLALLTSIVPDDARIDKDDAVPYFLHQNLKKHWYIFLGFPILILTFPLKLAALFSVGYLVLINIFLWWLGKKAVENF